MFGLMRAKKCGLSADERHFRRLNYCGTCKTIGSVYSAKARLLLNHDTVFLAELLTTVGSENVHEWQSSYRSFNCLSLPKGSIPVSLQWAAAANVILTEFKIADHVADREGVRYKIARRVFSKEFQKAERFLLERTFPLADVSSLLESQGSREARADSLDDLAYPTAQTTGIFFREGFRQIGCRDLEKSAFELGFAFGTLVYMIDAFEDYEKDLRLGQFNAFQAVYELSEKKFPVEVKRKVTAQLAELGAEIAAKIRSLPIAEDQKSLFISRLSHNLGRKLMTELPVVPAGNLCAVKPKQNLSQRWRAACEKARELARCYSWQMPLVFAFVLLFALVAPTAQAREARSARECFDLGFNLMFIGALFGSVLALPKKLLMQNPEPQQGAVEQVAKSGKKRRSGCCSDCACDCCDCCDCCTSCDC